MPGSFVGHSFLRLLLVCLFMVALLLFPQTSDAATSPMLSFDPPTVIVDVPLGQTSQITVTVRNTGDAAATPLLALAQPSDSSQEPQSGPSRVELPDRIEPIDPALLRSFRAAPDLRREFLVVLRDQADLSKAYAIDDWGQRGQFVYQTLRRHAAHTQAELLGSLAAHGLSYQSLWLVNAVLVRGSQADMQAFAARSDVAFIQANHIAALPEQPQATNPALCSPDEPDNSVCWNVRAIGADAAWRDFGATGRNIVVANIDTGVAFDHPALSGNYRGAQAGGTFQHDYNWFDPQFTQKAPTDSNNHGTHTMGTMVAAANDGVAVGIAPDARWIAAQGCEGTNCSVFDLISSAQWMLAPTRIDGSEPRPDLRPMIINNSWSGIPNDPWYSAYTAAWRAAGIFPVFAAGNANAFNPQACGSISSPGDYADVVAVGAVDRADTITGFSLIGPTRDKRLKPDVVAPGANIYSTVPNGGYAAFSGTSMAAPHVAATVALMWSANPALIGDYDATYALLRESAVQHDDNRCGDAASGPNNVYGYGRIDAYDAVARAQVDIPWLRAELASEPIQAKQTSKLTLRFDAATVPGPGEYQARVQVFNGSFAERLVTLPVTLRVTPVANQITLQGRVSSAENDQPLAAEVAVGRNSMSGLRVPTQADGSFQLTVVDGGLYRVEGSARSYLKAAQTFTATSGLSLDLRLEPDQPRLVVATDVLSESISFAEAITRVVPLENHGTQPLYYNVSIPNDKYYVTRSGETGGPQYRWIDLPANAAVLERGNDVLRQNVPLGITFPFSTVVLNKAVVTTDGMLTFDYPARYSGPTSQCLPDDILSFYTIAPLRLDFDTTNGGQVRYATLDRDRFVVSYEAVPLHNGSPQQTYTFQIVLYSDGRIVFQYKQLAALPSRVSAGVQYSPNDVLELGCGASMPLHDQLAIELRPQPNAAYWLSAPQLSGTILPGEQAELVLRLNWTRPSTLSPYHGRVVITSNDRRTTQTTLPVQLQARPAPYEIAFPFAPR